MHTYEREVCDILNSGVLAEVKAKMKYLNVTIDKDLKFKVHINYRNEKARKINDMLKSSKDNITGLHVLLRPVFCKCILSLKQ